MREKPLTEFMDPKKVAKGQGEEPAEPKSLKGPWELPEGWRWVRLGEIATLIRGASPRPKGDPRYFGGDIPWIKIKDVTKSPGKYLTKTEETLTKEGMKKSVYIKKGTLIVTNSATIGIPKILDIDGCIHDGFLAIPQLKSQVDRDWLYWYFWAIRPYLENLANLGVQKNLNTIIAKRLPVPLPPLSEQKRIVAKLDEVSKRLEEAKRLAREAREEAERLMASALHEVFSKAEERGWEWVKLGDVVTRRNETIDPTKNPDLPFVGLEHITPGEVKLNEYSSTADLKSQKYVFYPGDVLYGKLRPYLDKAVVATIKGMCSTDLLVLTPKEGLMPEYLVTFMHTPQFRELATQHMRGTNHPRISWRSLQKFKLPLPPLEEQKRIVAYLDSISERAQKLAKLYEERERELERLFPAILDRVFRGEL